MKPKLIDSYSIEKDIKLFHFNNNSFIVNTVILLIILFSLFCCFYVFKSPYNRKQKKDQVLYKLNYILNKSNEELLKQRR
jgi:hypothetical protein